MSRGICLRRQRSLTLQNRTDTPSVQRSTSGGDSPATRTTLQEGCQILHFNRGTWCSTTGKQRRNLRVAAALSLTHVFPAATRFYYIERICRPLHTRLVGPRHRIPTLSLPSHLHTLRRCTDCRYSAVWDADALQSGMAALRRLCHGIRDGGMLLQRLTCLLGSPRRRLRQRALWRSVLL
jgi:hypothetical protein